MYLQKKDHHIISDINITADEVKLKLKNLDIHKDTGPDKIPKYHQLFLKTFQVN